MSINNGDLMQEWCYTKRFEQNCEISYVFSIIIILIID